MQRKQSIASTVRGGGSAPAHYVVVDDCDCDLAMSAAQMGGKAGPRPTGAGAATRHPLLPDRRHDEIRGQSRLLMGRQRAEGKSASPCRGMRLSVVGGRRVGTECMFQRRRMDLLRGICLQRQSHESGMSSQVEGLITRTALFHRGWRRGRSQFWSDQSQDTGFHMS